MAEDIFDDKPTEECGVFGIFAPDQDVARITFFGLYALQHRGQESAGIATSDGEHIQIRTRIGLVSQAFAEDDLRFLTGHIAVGHARYSTQGSNSARNCGPMITDSDAGPVVVAHNGNLTNVIRLREELESDGERFLTSTDSEVLTRLIATSAGVDLGRQNHGGHAPDGRRLFAVHHDQGHAVRRARSPWVSDRSASARSAELWVVASESCALATVGATFIREVGAGEIVEIDGPDAISS